MNKNWIVMRVFSWWMIWDGSRREEKLERFRKLMKQLMEMRKITTMRKWIKT